MYTDKSEIQEVNPSKTVVPPLQPQPLNEEKHIRQGIEAYIDIIRVILEFQSQ